MRRREFVAGVGGVTALVCLPIGARAQPAAKTWRVGFLAYVTDNGPAEVRQRLQELGYVEGKNLIFQIHSAEGRAERLPELAAALVKSSPDAIIAGFGTVTAQAVKAATSTIPVVFASVGDPIETGIVAELRAGPAQTSPGFTLRPPKSPASGCKSCRSLLRRCARSPW